MVLCKVTGTLVSTHKSEQLRAAKLLIVQRVDLQRRPVGAGEMLALDPHFDAGVGDVVLVAKEGAVAAQLMKAGGAAGGVPANVIVLGVVDDWAIR